MSTIATPKNSDWHKELELLILRHEEQGAGHDMASMTETERLGLYLYLKKLEG